MNHIYKVIWNTITQTWVAVSELSRAKGKTKSSKTLSAVVLAAVSGILISGEAQSANEVGSAKDNSSVVFGTQSYASHDAVAVGGESNARAYEDVAIGYKATSGAELKIENGKEVTHSSNQSSVAVGTHAQATHVATTAIGAHAQAIHNFATAVGAGAIANHENASAFGEGAKAQGTYSTALGKGATATKDYAVALGKEASSTNTYSTSIGTKANATGQSSLAIGGAAIDSLPIKTNNEGKQYSDLEDGVGAKATGQDSAAIGASANATANAALAVGKMANASANSTIAVGDKAQASGEKATSIGAGAIAKNQGTIAIGDRAKVGATNGNVAATNGIAIGTESESKDQQAIAVGKKAIAAGNNSIAMGNSTTTTGGDSVAIGNTTTASHHSVALGANALASAGWSSAVGNESKATATDASAFGNSANAGGVNSTAIGSHSTVTANNGSTLGNYASVSAEGGVALGQGSASSRTALNANNVHISDAGTITSSTGISDNDIKNNKNHDVYAPVKLINDPSTLERVKNTIKGTAGAVSLGNATTTRQLTNLAPGSADSDAVNVAQLKAVVGGIVKYNVTSPDKSITIDSKDETTDGVRKTTFNVTMNTTAVKDAAAWKIKANKETDNQAASVKGGDIVTFKAKDGGNSGDTIKITRNGKELTFEANFATIRTPGTGMVNVDDTVKDNWLAKAKNVAEAINASGWILQANGNKVGLINPGNKVNIATDANSGITITPTNENADGVSTIKLKANVTGLTAGNNVTISSKDGNYTINAIDTNTQASVSPKSGSPITVTKTTTTPNSPDYAVGLNIDDKTLEIKGGKLAARTQAQPIESVEKKDVEDNIAEVDVKSGSTKGAANAVYTVAVTKSAVKDAAAWNIKEGSETTSTAVKGGDTLTLSDTNTIDVVHNGKDFTFNAKTATIQTEQKQAITKIDVSNAGITTKTTGGNNTPTGRFVVPTGNDTDKHALATAYDVADKVNQTGWNLYTNGGAPILINPGDYVNFKSGKATNANIVTEASEGATISYDVNVDNTTIKIDSDGNKLTANTVDLTVNKTGDKAGTVGTPEDADKGKLVTAENVAKAVNESFWVAKKGDRVETNADTTSDDSNVTAGSNVTFVAGKNIALQKDGNKFIYATKDNVTFTDVTTNNFTVNANGNVDMGGNQIHNVGEGTAETDAVNVKQLNESVSTESVIKKADDDNIAEVAPGAGHTLKGKGAQYEVSVSKAKVREIAKEAVKVNTSTASDNPITVTPHTENGNVTYAVNVNKTDLSSATTNGKITVPTDSGLVTAKDVANAINAAYWNLNVGGTDVQNVKAGDTVKFTNGKGTTVEYDKAGKAIKVNANVTDITAGNSNITVDKGNDGNYTISATDTNTQASVSNATDSPITIDSTGINSVGAKDYKLDVNVDGTTITKTGGVLKAVIPAIEKVDLTVNKTGDKAGTVGTPEDADKGKLVTAENVAKAVNESFWVAKKGDRVETNADTTSDDSNVTAGSNVTFVAGKNIALQKDGNKFIYATKDNVTFTDVTTNNFTVNANGNVDMGGNQIHNVGEGTAETDAVNVKQLKSTERHITPTTYTYSDKDSSVTLTYTDGNGNLVQDTNAKIDLSGLASKIKDYSFKTNATGSNLVGTGTDTTIASGKSVNFAASDNLTLKQDVNAGNVTYTYALKNQVVVGEKGTPGADGKPGKDGVDGSIGVNGKDGSAVAINGKDGSIGLNGKDGKNGLTIKGQDGKVGVDGKDGETRLVYVEKADPTKPGSSDKTHELATLDDGMKYGGDIGEVANVKLNKQVDIKGGVTDKTKLSDNNIGVISTPNATTGGTELTVKLAKELKGLTSAEFKGGDDNAVTNITNSGITIKPANSNDDSKTVSLTNTGLNNGGNKITHVAEGKDDTDAVNVKQLKDFKTEVNGYGWNLSVNNGENSSKITKDTTVDLNNDDGNIKIAKNGSNVTLSLGPDVGLGKAGKDGKDGSLAVRGKDGTSVEISGKDGSIGLTGPKGKDGTPGASATITAEKGTTTVNDDRDGGKQVNRIVYTDKDKDGNDIKREIATLDDGLKFKGDSKEVINRTLGSQMNITGGANENKLTDKNIGVVYDKATNGLKVKLSKDVNLGDNGTITIGDTVVNKDGLTINGGPSVTKGGVNAGNQSVTNVKDGTADNDAVNVKQLKAAKTEVEAGDHIDVTSRVGANGQTIYKVSAKGINDTSAAVKAGSDHVKVTKAANTHKDGSTTVTDYTVDLSDKTKEDIKKGVDAHTEVTTKGLTFNADTGTTGVKKLGSKVAVNGDGKNITTTADENGVKVSMKDDIKVNSVTAKEVKVGDVNINENGINAGGKRITNVAPGKDGTDAVNVNQLKYVAGNISNQINNVDKGLRAGIAGALASGGLYHVTTAGKSMVSVGAGTYRGQNALAVGYSRLSDNGKVGVKFTVNSNSQGHAGASASVGYQW